MFSKISLSLVFVTLLSVPAFSQAEKGVKVNGRFLVDSIKIGEQVPYSLTAFYPSSSNLVFPDSTFSFAPFEFSKKKYFQTKTKDNLSYDSVVYFVTTFEIDSIQTLKLPVFEIHKKDCTAVFSESDTLFLKHLVTQKTDSIDAPALPLKTNTTYQNVKWLLDYPFLLAIVGVLLIASVVVWIIFGKKIKRYFKARKLSKNHEAFLNKFTTTVSELSVNYSPSKAEKTMLLWKNYMEKLSARPFTKSTSKEIVIQEKDEALGRALQVIDRMVYGGSAFTSEPFDSLRTFSNNQFANKLKEVNRG